MEPKEIAQIVFYLVMGSVLLWAFFAAYKSLLADTKVRTSLFQDFFAKDGFERITELGWAVDCQAFTFRYKGRKAEWVEYGLPNSKLAKGSRIRLYLRDGERPNGLVNVRSRALGESPDTNAEFHDLTAMDLQTFQQTMSVRTNDDAAALGLLNGTTRSRLIEVERFFRTIDCQISYRSVFIDGRNDVSTPDELETLFGSLSGLYDALLTVIEETTARRRQS